jgi:hypothetical protein
VRMDRKRNRHIRRTLFFCISLSLALWRLPPMIETFNKKMNSGDGATSSLLSAMSTAAGATGGKAGANSEKTMVLIPAKGKELTPKQHAQLIRNARRLAPLSYNQQPAPTLKTLQKDAPATAAAAKQDEQAVPSMKELQKQAEEALKMIKEQG